MGILDIPDTALKNRIQQCGFFYASIVCQLVYVFSATEILLEGIIVGGFKHIYFAGKDVESIKSLEGKPVDYTCLPRRNTELYHIFPYLGFDIVYVLFDLLFILTLTDKNDILVLYNDIVFQAL